MVDIEAFADLRRNNPSSRTCGSTAKLQFTQTLLCSQS